MILYLSMVLIGRSQDVNPVRPALLIVDIQEFYFPSENRPGLVNAEEASLRAKEVLQLFRDQHLPVVHVRHQSSTGFEFNENVRPVEGEKVITKEEVNSFLGTDLLDYLHEKDINRLVIIGMQTHMCLEAAVRAAHDYGFECIVVQDACATKDLKYGDKLVRAEDVHASTLATLQTGGYAKITDLAGFKENPELFLFKTIP